MNIENIKTRAILDGLRMEIDNRLEQVMSISTKYVGRQINTSEYAGAIAQIENQLSELHQLRTEHLAVQAKVKQ